MKAAMKFILSLSIMAVFLNMSFSVALLADQTSTIHGVFYQANELFKQAKYEQAEQEYLRLMRMNIESGNLYYNLGNTYFKLGKLGKAIVSYERAKYFIPRDSDLKANLDFALSLCENHIIAPKRFWILRLLQNLSSYFTFDGLTILFSYTYFFLAITISLALLFKKAKFWLSRIIIAGVIAITIIGSTWGLKLYELYFKHYAIVIISSAEAKFAPSQDAVTHFKVYEGAKVNIIGEDKTWLRVKTADAKIGWVPREIVEKI